VDKNRLQPPFQHGALEKDAAVAGQAAQADVGAEACDLPVVAAAGMGFAQAQDVAKLEVEDRCQASVGRLMSCR
jgi:hypothetical protein